MQSESTMPIKVSVVEVKRGPALMLDFTITGSAEKSRTYSKVFNIDDIAAVWFKFKHPNEKPAGVDTNSLKFKLKFMKHKSALDSEIKLNVTCEKMNFSKLWTKSDDFALKIDMGTVEIPLSEAYSLKLNLLAIKVEKNTSAKLYDDTDLIDYHLSTEEGKVPVHKACLAMHSDMFKAMLVGKWKETTEGCVELKGVRLKTLQQLKEYIYLGTLPEDVRQLLLLAKCYLLDNLKQDCLMKLVRTISSENLYELQEFACENNVIELSRLLLQVVTSDVIHGAHEIKKSKENDAQNEK